MDLYYPNYIENPVIDVRNLDGSDKECFVVDIDNRDIDMCKKYRTAVSNKPGTYGRGLLNTKKKGVTETVGLLGEIAFGKVFNLPVDVSYSSGGDFGDFKLIDKILDLKTAQTNYGKVLIQACNEFGYDIKMKSNMYAGAYMEGEYGPVVIVGWQTRKYISSKPIVPAIRGTHYNRELLYSEMLSIKELLEKYKKHLTNEI